MKKKEEFEKLIDSVLNRFTQAKDLRDRVYIDAEEILRIFINLNQRIEEQREHIDELSKKLKDSEKNLNLLIKELVRSGYIKVGEKRNYLRRNIHSVEAIIALLQKNNILNKKALVRELKKSRETEKKAIKT
jgi:SOS response regulatory protein OraA/RecX